MLRQATLPACGDVRTTAESHRRIAIAEVMGRNSGFITLGSAYGQPDLVLIPDHPLDLALVVERVKEPYDVQKNVVIVCCEGMVDARERAGRGHWGAGNPDLSGPTSDPPKPFGASLWLGGSQRLSAIGVNRFFIGQGRPCRDGDCRNSSRYLGSIAPTTIEPRPTRSRQPTIMHPKRGP